MKSLIRNRNSQKSILLVINYGTPKLDGRKFFLELLRRRIAVFQWKKMTDNKKYNKNLMN